jgi:hypothetical protein
MRTASFGGGGGSSASVQFPADTGRDFRCSSGCCLRFCLRVHHERARWRPATNHTGVVGMSIGVRRCVLNVTLTGSRHVVLEWRSKWWARACCPGQDLACGTLEASGGTRGTSAAVGDRSVIADVALALAGTQILAQVADDASLDGRATGLIGFNGALLAVTIAAKGLLGTFWWAPPVVVVISTLMLLRALYGLFVSACLIAADRPTKVETCLKIQAPGQQSKKALCLSLLPRVLSTSGQMGRSQTPEPTGELLKLATRIEGGVHGVLYEVAEIAEGQQ